VQKARWLLVALAAMLAGVSAQGADSAHRRSPCLSYLVLDVDNGRVLRSENSSAEAYPASCTKLMTAHLVYRAIRCGRLRKTDLIAQSERSNRESPSRLDLKPGETISVDDAMKALMLKSANDVAVMLAEKVGGSVENFVDLMNEEARRLDMKNTRYVTPNGLPPPKGSKRGFDRSTAQDLAKLASVLLRESPEILDYTSLASATVPGRDGKSLWIQNHNNILWKRGYKVPGADGLKTGYNNAGGSSIVLTGRRGGHRAVVVVLGSNSAAERDKLAGELLEDALMSFE